MWTQGERGWKKGNLGPKMCTRIGVQGSEGKHQFIKHDITGHIDTTNNDIKAFVALMMSAIAKKGTLFGAEHKFVFVIWAEVGLSSTPKGAEKGVGRFCGKKLINGRGMI
jgi:hypothetical protein